MHSAAFRDTKTNRLSTNFEAKREKTQWHLKTIKLPLKTTRAHNSTTHVAATPVSSFVIHLSPISKGSGDKIVQ